MASDNEVLFLIKTILDSKGINEARAALDGLVAKSKEAGSSGAGKDLVASYDALKSAISGASSSGEGLFKSILAGAKGVPPAVAGGVAAVGGLVLAYKAASAAVADFAEKQDSVAKLDAVLANNGQLTDSYREKLQALANQMEDATAIGDEQWMGVLARLTQFGADNSNIEGYSKAVENLAGIIGGDVQTAANMFSRAMQGNFDLFGRYGIHVEEAGTQTERLNKLMEQLAQRGGGVLANQAQTINGQMKAMHNATSDLSAAFGQLIAKTGLVQAFATNVSIFSNALSSALGGDKIDRVGELSNKFNLVEAATSDARLELEKLAGASLNKPVDDASKLSEKLKDAASTADKLMSALSALEDAELQGKLAQVDLAVNSGKITKEEGELQKIGIRTEYQQRSLLGQEAALSGEKDKRSEILEQTKAEAEQAIASANATRARLDAVLAKTEGMSPKAAGENLYLAGQTGDRAAIAEAEGIIKALEQAATIAKEYEAQKKTAEDKSKVYADAKTANENEITVLETKLRENRVKQGTLEVQAKAEEEKVRADIRKNNEDSRRQEAEETERSEKERARQADEAAQKDLDARMEQNKVAMDKAKSPEDIRKAYEAQKALEVEGLGKDADPRKVAATRDRVDMDLRKRLQREAEEVMGRVVDVESEEAADAKGVAGLKTPGTKRGRDLQRQRQAKAQSESSDVDAAKAAAERVKSGAMGINELMSLLQQAATSFESLRQEVTNLKGRFKTDRD